ncbi:MAG: NDP-sugar synthase [bacterium]|nr:NDP-sugar synthase [bacterium]
MKALILIGGLGTRLRPFTCNTPKPLLPIVNKPFLLYQIELLKKYGIKEVIFCLAYLSHTFENHFGNGSKYGIKIHYVHEHDPLGTGGAIKNAQKYIDSQVLIFNGDVLMDIDIEAMCRYHTKNKAKATIALTRVKDPTIFGLVETAKNGRIERFLEKPSWDEVTCNTINAGVYIFEPEVLSLIPQGINYSVERGLFPNLLSTNEKLFGFINTSYWIDIGTIEKYLQVHFDIIDGIAGASIEGRKTGKNVWQGSNSFISKDAMVDGKLVMGNKARIEEFAQINGKVTLGNGVIIRKGAILNDCVVHDHTEVGEGARLEKCLVGKQCIIEPHTSLSPGAALADHSILKKYSKL